MTMRGLSLFTILKVSLKKIVKLSKSETFVSVINNIVVYLKLILNGSFRILIVYIEKFSNAILIIILAF